MDEFNRKIEDFFSELGLSKKKIQEFLESGKKDYRTFLSMKGARRINYQKDLRSHVRHRGVILIEAKVIITSTTQNGINVAIVESEETEEWLYFGKTAIEPPTLVVYKKFFEIMEKNVDYDLVYIGEKTKTIVKENRDIVYNICLFYQVKVPYEVLEKVGREKKRVIQVFSEKEFNELLM